MKYKKDFLTAEQINAEFRLNAETRRERKRRAMAYFILAGYGLMMLAILALQLRGM